MLNQQIDPQRLTRDDFEKHVDALQQAIAKHFDIHTQKKGKLRDVAAMTLFGFENGYQQALAHFQQPMPVMPLPETRMALPNEVTMIVRGDLSDVVVCGPSEIQFGDLTHGNVIHAVLDEYQEWSDTDEQDAVYQNNGRAMELDFSGSQVMRQLHHDYVVSDIQVRMPRIDKYGIAPEGTIEGALALLQGLQLVDNSVNEDTIADLHHVSDSGDDGAHPIIIVLRSKAFLARIEENKALIDQAARQCYLLATKRSADDTIPKEEQALAWEAYRALVNAMDGDTYLFRDHSLKESLWSLIAETIPNPDTITALRTLLDI